MARQRPSFMAQLRAIFREGIKDIRSTMHQVFFGRPEGPSEPGTPLNPTPQIVTQDLGRNRGDYNAMLDQYVNRGRQQGRQQNRGLER